MHWKSGRRSQKMNYYKKILTYLIPILILVSINFSQDLSIDLTFLNTGQFTLNSWNNVAELWKLEIENTDTVKIDYYLKFILKNNNEENLIIYHKNPRQRRRKFLGNVLPKFTPPLVLVDLTTRGGVKL